MNDQKIFGEDPCMHTRAPGETWARAQVIAYAPAWIANTCMDLHQNCRGSSYEFKFQII